MTTKSLDITQIKEYLPHRYPFLLVDRVLDGRRRVWAVVAAFGDNLAESARRAAVPLHLAAGLVVAKLGTATVSFAELRQALQHAGSEHRRTEDAGSEEVRRIWPDKWHERQRRLFGRLDHHALPFGRGVDRGGCCDDDADRHEDREHAPNDDVGAGVRQVVVRHPFLHDRVLLVHLHVR